MDTIKPLYTATATAVGGRNGHTESSDHIVAFDLSVPKEMGGPGKPGTATPEHLFAAGYAACFGGAIDFVAKQHKQDATKAKVTCAVSIGPRDGGGFGLAVKMRVEDRSLPQADLELISEETGDRPLWRYGRGNRLAAVIGIDRARDVRAASTALAAQFSAAPKAISSTQAL